MTIVRIDIVYCGARASVLKSFTLPQGASLAQALRLAAEDADFEAVDFSAAPVGIFGQLATPDRILNDGDRVEIYRPLVNDPKDARRKRALRTRT